VSTPLSDPDNVMFYVVDNYVPPDDGFTDDEVQRILNGQSMTASAVGTDSFHLPGKHDQEAHGHGDSKPGEGKSQKAGKALKITHSLVHKKYSPGTVIAENGTGDKRVTWDGSKYLLQQKKGSDWTTDKTAIKSKAYVEINGFDSDWREPNNEGDNGSAKADKAPAIAPTPPTAPAPASPASVTQPGTYTPLQRSKVQTIFANNNVKWHNDVKKIYDSALEVSKTHSDLTMSDALDIMDQSLKKTDKPFRTKVTKFLGTLTGKNYVASKGGSAPANSVKQTMPVVVAPAKPAPAKPAPTPTPAKPTPAPTPAPAPAPTSAPAKPAPAPTSIPSLDEGPVTSPPSKNYKNKTEVKEAVRGKTLTPATAAALQRNMNKATPPPLSYSKKKALNTYSEGAYQDINGCLRGDKWSPCTPAINKTISQIKDSMKPSTEDVQLYRSASHWSFGVDSPEELHSLVGKTFVEKGVVSTSIKEFKWSGDVDIYIEAPKGTKMVWMKPYSEHPDEEEMTLAPDQRFEIISVTSLSKFTKPKVVLRVIPE
jgi:hypothetical protein